MKTHVLMPAILGAVMLSAPVLAAAPSPAGSGPKPVPHYQTLAAMTPTERCTALEHQFDDAIKTHPKSATVKSAKSMRTEGGTLCAGGKQAEGVQKLEQAVKALGETPKS